MEVRYAANQEQTKEYDTEKLRSEYLIEGLMVEGELKMVYGHVDRVIAGGAVPGHRPLALEVDKKQLGSEFFLERREIGIFNVAGPGTLHVDGQVYNLKHSDCLYIGKGAREVLFASDDASQPAHFYFVSTPAHKSYPTAKIPIKEATAAHMGSIAASNERTIHKYIHPGGVKSCQLVMGMTILEPNNMWNSMPCHTHDRRMEVYFYCGLPSDGVVFHFMGEPTETRHLVVRDEQAVISPSWSVHCGVGTSNYAFIWAMAGENQLFEDMDPVTIEEMR